MYRSVIVSTMGVVNTSNGLCSFLRLAPAGLFLFFDQMSCPANGGINNPMPQCFWYSYWFALHPLDLSYKTWYKCIYGKSLHNLRKNIPNGRQAQAFARALQPRQMGAQIPQSPMGYFGLRRACQALHQVHQERQAPCRSRRQIISRKL